VVGDPSAIPPVQQEAQRQLQDAEGADASFKGIQRMQFYERARKAYAVLTTGERRHYGCFILKKGVVTPPVQGQA
jgi:L-fucose mutarotase